MGASTRTCSCSMMSLKFAVLVAVIGLSQGSLVPPPSPVPHPQPPPGYRPVSYGRPSPFGGFGGGIDPTTLLLLGGGKGGLGGPHGGINPLVLSLLNSCKEPATPCTKPNTGNTLCGAGGNGINPCCICKDGLF